LIIIINLFLFPSSPGGWKILDDPVVRLFPTDLQSDYDPEAADLHEEPLQDTIHEALTKHLRGLRFREWNAGTRIDEHMRDNGFNNQIGVDLTTGFVFGGNIDNCGTWMDKMGSSAVAGNKGVPSTPRDGAAVEIVGLAYACLTALARIPQYKHQVRMIGTRQLKPK
jgi:glycogen debranching enzyme